MNESTALSEYLRQQEFIAFDTETTGMWAPINRIVELAAVKFTLSGGVVDTFQSLVNPLRPIPQEVIEIHGITDQMVQDAPTVEPALEKFIDFCGSDSILVAHNAPFDISFIGIELDRSNLAFGDNPILDTVDIYHRFFPGLPSYSLLNLIRHFEIAASQQHRALSDAEFVYRLVATAAPKLASAKNFDDLSAMVSTYTMSAWESEKADLPEDFADLQSAIEKNCRVSIDYDHPVKPSTDRIIRPQQVFQLGSVFYINAFCERAQAARTFRLDRIRRYVVLDNSEQGE